MLYTIPEGCLSILIGYLCAADAIAFSMVSKYAKSLIDCCSYKVEEMAKLLRGCCMETFYAPIYPLSIRHFASLRLHADTIIKYSKSLRDEVYDDSGIMYSYERLEVAISRSRIVIAIIIDTYSEVCPEFHSKRETIFTIRRARRGGHGRLRVIEMIEYVNSGVYDHSRVLSVPITGINRKMVLQMIANDNDIFNSLRRIAGLI